MGRLVNQKQLKLSKIYSNKLPTKRSNHMSA